MSKLPPERKYTLDEELFSRVLNSIISAYTIGRQPASSSLKAFYVVGQPAAGKTLLRDYLLSSLGIRNSTIVCNTDDIRTHHPDYEDLLNNPDTLVKAPFLVNEDSSKLTDKLFQYAINNKYHVLIDATFGSQDLSHYFRQISTLLASGYSISFNVLAVHLSESVLHRVLGTSEPVLVRVSFPAQKYKHHITVLIFFLAARVVELVDTQDLKSCDP